MTMLKTDKEELLIGLISDTHIPSRGPAIPASIIEDFKKREIDFLFHLGDYEKYFVYENLLEAFGKEKVIGISGNMDDNKIRKTLPSQLEFELLGHKIFMTHGMGGPNIIIKRLNKNFNLSKYDIIIFGHVHRPYNVKWRDGKWYLNPGTPTDKRFTDINSYAFLHLTRTDVNLEIIYL
ncbi:MAG: metallophosphoesterase family protein [Promethearchaeota archaeon]